MRFFIRQILQRVTAPLLFLSMAAGASAAGIDDVLEFRGYIRIGGEMQFSIYNKQEQRSAWVRVNEKQPGYTIEHFDRETDSLVVRYSGGIGNLSLQSSRIARYIPPIPEKPESLPADKLTAALNAGIGSANNAPTINDPFAAPTANRQPRADTADTRANPPQLSGTGRPASPTVPPLPGPRGTPRDDDSDEDDSDDDEWQSTGTPPPMPPTSAPNYSPED